MIRVRRIRLTSGQNQGQADNNKKKRLWRHGRDSATVLETPSTAGLALGSPRIANRRQPIAKRDTHAPPSAIGYLLLALRGEPKASPATTIRSRWKTSLELRRSGSVQGSAVNGGGSR